MLKIQIRLRSQLFSVICHRNGGGSESFLHVTDTMVRITCAPRTFFFEVVLKTISLPCFLNTLLDLVLPWCCGGADSVDSGRWLHERVRSPEGRGRAVVVPAWSAPFDKTCGKMPLLWRCWKVASAWRPCSVTSFVSVWIRGGRGVAQSARASPKLRVLCMRQAGIKWTRLSPRSPQCAATCSEVVHVLA